MQSQQELLSGPPQVFGEKYPPPRRPKAHGKVMNQATPTAEFMGVPEGPNGEGAAEHRAA